MSSQTQQRYTPEEYLALERQAQCKSEYYAGEIFAMAGASRWHNLIVANVIGELRSTTQGASLYHVPQRYARQDQSYRSVSPTPMSPWSAAKPCSKTTSKTPC